MQLGAMPILNNSNKKEIGATDIDFSAIEERLKKIERNQMIIMIAIAVTLFLTISKK